MIDHARDVYLNIIYWHCHLSIFFAKSKEAQNIIHIIWEIAVIEFALCLVVSYYVSTNILTFVEPDRTLVEDIMIISTEESMFSNCWRNHSNHWVELQTDYWNHRKKPCIGCKAFK